MLGTRMGAEGEGDELKDRNRWLSTDIFLLWSLLLVGSDKEDMVGTGRLLNNMEGIFGGFRLGPTEFLCPAFEEEQDDTEP